MKMDKIWALARRPLVVIAALIVVVILVLAVLVFMNVEQQRERPIFRRAFLSLLPDAGEGKRSGTLAVEAEFDEVADEARMRRITSDFIDAKWGSNMNAHDFLRLLYVELSAANLLNVQTRYATDPLEFISFGYQPG